MATFGCKWLLVLVLIALLTRNFAKVTDGDIVDGAGGDDGLPPVVDDDEDGPLAEETSETEDDKEEVVIDPLEYVTPTPDGPAPFFWDGFKDQSSIGKKWFKSEAKKDGVEENLAKYDGEWEVGTADTVVMTNDFGLIVKTKAHHHAIASKLARPFTFDGKPLVFQYDVKYQQGQECGGGYVKLLSRNAQLNLKMFTDKTPYTIMFGPDKCGMTSKVHFIIRYENPKNNTISEHHAKASSKSLDEYFNDHKSHLYTLVVNPDSTYKVSVDQTEIMSGSLLKDVEPSILPPKTVDDPDDKKPEDWDDREKISDPDAVKPDDWDESAPEKIEDPDAKKPDDWLEDEEENIPDETATKPDDWDEEMDGQWEAPRIKNPKCEMVSGCGKWIPAKIKNPAYKGKWSAPKIDNPKYKGKWAPRVIDNPNYFELETAYQMTPIAAIGLELWTMSDGILFDNFLLTDDPSQADAVAKATWLVKQQQEKRFASAKASKESFFNGLLQQANEKPWLWGVLVIVILIPIVLISVCCFGGSKADPAADAKKTDAVTADDEEELDEDEDSAAPLLTTPDADEASNLDKNKAAGDDSPSRRRTSPRKKQAATRDDLEQEDDEEQSMDTGDDEKPKGSPGRRARQRRQD